MSNKKDTFYITTPIYYVNDKPHIGHAYTTIVADVLARYYRLKLGADNVYFLTGTDEHGAKVAEVAKKNNISPQSLVDQISSQFKAVWQNLAIANDDFIRTSEDRHREIVSQILLKLKAAKTPQGREVLYEADYEGLYCVGCEKFILESELVDGKCVLHNREPEKVKEKNWFFRLSDYLPLLQELITKDKLNIYPTTRKNEVLGLVEKQNLPDFSISRSAKAVSWGIDLPWDNTQKVYVWVDALSNYISALGYPDGDKYQKFWPAQVQVMALDILKFHALYWPAILMALGEELPRTLLIHGFFTIDGQKMSKSLGNVIDPQDIVAKYGAEATKYLILSQFSFGSESDIRVDDFNNKYNADLVNGLGNLLSRATNMIELYAGGQIELDKKSLTKVVGATEIENFRFREALLSIWEVVRSLNALIDQEKPWVIAKSENTKDKEKLNKILNTLASDLMVIANSLEPFMPLTAAKIWEILKAPKISKPSQALFPRL